ncbi:hypothetical protein FRC03_010153 [Tulasnella sp. 419]|nr:hypothetical protein FRC03_010153 [Tulasnella sp. 419]
MDPYSIFEELTRLATTTPAPSTDVIAFLVRSLAQEACDGIRGAQTYYRILNRARDICDRANELVDEAERTKDWTYYNSWTAQIGPLEEILLAISELVESETGAAYSPPSHKSISECLESVGSWKQNRKICRDAAQMLHAPPFELPAYAWDGDLKAAALHDDLSWVSSICEAITEILAPMFAKFQEKPKQYTHIIEVVRLLAEIQTSLELSAEIEDSRILLSTRCFMVMHGVIAVAEDDSVEQRIRKHLWSRRTWKRAFGLLEKLKTVIGDISGSLEGLVEEWEAYEEYLLNPKEKSVDKVLEQLIPYPSKIQRPYHAQAVALVNLCLNIGEQVKSNKPDDGIDVLEEIVESTIKALDMSALASAQVIKFDWDKLRANPASKAIDEVVNEVRIVYKDLEMEVEVVNNEISLALKKDRDVVEMLRGHFSRQQNRKKPMEAKTCECGQVYSLQLKIANKDDLSPPVPVSHITKSGGDIDSVLWKLGAPNQSFNQTSAPLADRPRFYINDKTSNKRKPLQRGKLKDGLEIEVVRNTKSKQFTSPLLNVLVDSVHQIQEPKDFIGKVNESNEEKHNPPTLLGYSTLKPPVSDRARRKLLLKSKKLFDITDEGLDGGHSATESDDSRAKNTITYAHIAPGYLLFQHLHNRRQLQIRQLGLLSTGDGFELDIHQQIVAVAVDDASQRFAYVTKDNQGQYLLYLNTIPPAPNAPRPLNIEKKVEQIFWINSENIGLIMDDNGRKNVYQYQVSSGSKSRHSLRLLFTLEGTVQEKGRLYHSVVSDGEEEWIAINMFKGEERYVQVWSRKSMASHVVKGVGMITRLNLGGKPLTLLITADRPVKEGQISMVTYELMHGSIKKPYKIFEKQMDAKELPGDPSFVHVFEDYGIGLAVTSTGAAAAAFLFDIYTGEKLQSIQEHVKWQGSFSCDLAPTDPTRTGSALGLLVLDPLGNVNRMTIDEALLNKEWRSRALAKEDPDIVGGFLG